MGKYDIAVQLCRQALEVRKNKSGEKSPDYAASLNSLGELYMQKGKYDTAALLLRQSLTIRKQVLGNEHPDYVKSLNSSGLLNIASGDNTNAAALLVEANHIALKLFLRTYTSLSEQEKLNLINEEYLQFSYLPSLLFKNPTMPPASLQQVYTNAMILKGMVLEDQQQVLTRIRKSDDSATLKIFGQWRNNKSFLGQQFLLPVNQRVAYLDSIKTHTNSLEQQLSRASAIFRNMRQSETITAKIIGKKLKEGQAAIEFLMFRLYNRKWTDSTLYAAIVLLPGDSAGRFIPLFEENQLQRLLKLSAKGDAWAVNKLYSGVMQTGIRSDSTGNSLYRLLWKPLEKYLTNVNTIWYAPVGLLHRIAFNALRCDSAHLLLDKYHLMQVFSTRSLALPHPVISKPASICVWGNIQYNKTDTTQSQAFTKVQSGINATASSFNFYPSNERRSKNEPWQPLPGTKLEMDSLKYLFKDSGISIFTASDTNATEERFKSFDGKSQQVLHIATHGFFLMKKIQR